MKIVARRWIAILGEKNLLYYFQAEGGFIDLTFLPNLSKR